MTPGCNTFPEDSTDVVESNANVLQSTLMQKCSLRLQSMFISLENLIICKYDRYLFVYEIPSQIGQLLLGDSIFLSKDCTCGAGRYYQAMYAVDYFTLRMSDDAHLLTAILDIYARRK
ncbi:hypothetical protein TNCV_3470151 [Trichonephila clavipes]|nr:hypothetical protein TNCV_3470151 [Trichonephila clavipes]